MADPKTAAKCPDCGGEMHDARTCKLGHRQPPKCTCDADPATCSTHRVWARLSYFKGQTGPTFIFFDDEEARRD